MTSVVRLKARLHTGDPGPQGVDNISAVNPYMADVSMAVRDGWKWEIERGREPRWERLGGTPAETVCFVTLWNDDQQLVFQFPIAADGAGFRWKKKFRSLTVDTFEIQSKLPA